VRPLPRHSRPVLTTGRRRRGPLDSNAPMPRHAKGQEVEFRASPSWSRPMVRRTRGSRSERAQAPRPKTDPGRRRRGPPIPPSRDPIDRRRMYRRVVGPLVVERSGAGAAPLVRPASSPRQHAPVHESAPGCTPRGLVSIWATRVGSNQMQRSRVRQGPGPVASWRVRPFPRRTAGGHLHRQDWSSSQRNVWPETPDRASRADARRGTDNSSEHFAAAPRGAMRFAPPHDHSLNITLHNGTPAPVLVPVCPSAVDPTALRRIRQDN